MKSVRRHPATPVEPPALPQPLALSDGDFRLFQVLINREAGLWLAPTKKALLEGRLGQRLRELGVASWTAYHALVVKDREERIRMLDAVATCETRFFREALHWDFLARRLLPAWRVEADAGRRPRRIRAWSAGCSTGEEAFSLAMTLLAALPRGWDLRVLATDLSTRALERSQQAEWPGQQAREIPPGYLKLYMLRGAGGDGETLRAGPEIRALVRFEQLNLAAPTYPDRGAFDLILCRNVLMYFDGQTRSRVVERLIDRLVPGGHLFLGHAESLAGVTGRVRSVQPTIYALPAPGEGS